MKSSLAALLLITSLLAGCADLQASLRKRAAFDLQCPEASLVVTDLGGVRGVEGCGHRATYVNRCDEGSKPADASLCPWIMNTVDGSVAPAAKK